MTLLWQQSPKTAIDGFGSFVHRGWCKIGTNDGTWLNMDLSDDQMKNGVFLLLMRLHIFFNFQVRTRFGSSFTVWDVGGQDKLRPLWRSYTRCTDGIIFVVDSCKAERMEEAKLELMRIAKSASHATVPILVLANKQDLPSALETTKLEAVLGLKDLGPHVTWHLQSTCAITGEGLDEGMEKLQEMITRRRRSNMTNFITNGRRKNVSTAQKATRKVKRSHSYHHWWRARKTFSTSVSDWKENFERLTKVCSIPCMISAKRISSSKGLLWKTLAASCPKRRKPFEWSEIAHSRENMAGREEKRDQWKKPVVCELRGPLLYSFPRGSFHWRNRFRKQTSFLDFCKATTTQRRLYFSPYQVKLAHIDAGLYTWIKFWLNKWAPLIA